MDIIAARVGNGRAIHRAFRYDDGGKSYTSCGAEGGRGKSYGLPVRTVDAEVTCRSCGPATATEAVRARRAADPERVAPAPSLYAPFASRREWLLDRAEKLEAEGKTNLAAEARLDAEKENGR